LNALQQQLLSDVQEKKHAVTVNGMKANSNVCPFIPTGCLQKFVFPSSIIEKKKELRHCGRITHICVFNMVKLGTSTSASSP